MNSKLKFIGSYKFTGDWEEVKTLFNNASESTRLLIVLALNCSFTQKDIATLEHSHIDWERGLIIRPRSKTGVPMKSKLWKITLDLLKKFATNPKKSDLVLIGENGQSLVSEKIKPDGTPYRVDSIRLGFVRKLVFSCFGNSCILMSRPFNTRR